ncbi:hypothetical protein NHQ30_008744 [Ciborinia camelliae]|nr:hypothetical protein NHQ30_008744 [Ciborinia camelliae]
MAPQPIPLRTLTTLLNYERLVSDPRYKSTSLHSSSIANPSILPEMLSQEIIKSRPATIEKINVHGFLHNASSRDPAPQTSLMPTTCTIHPQCSPSIRKLSPSQLEDIFYESRSHDGCYKALTLYQEFFNLCPPDQQLEIQVKNEEPVLVTPFPRLILEFQTIGPKLLSCASLKLKNGGATYITGGEKQGVHSILGFPTPGTDMSRAFLHSFYVVDMTCMQWGERGIFGEPYFLGKGEEWQDMMANVCHDMEELGIGASWISKHPDTELMRQCATRVWERWANRENAAWCDYCGVGGRLSACSQCKTRKVWYCGVEHQKKAWKLHKFTCERKKTQGLDKK